MQETLVWARLAYQLPLSFWFTRTGQRTHPNGLTSNRGFRPSCRQTGNYYPVHSARLKRCHTASSARLVIGKRASRQTERVVKLTENATSQAHRHSEATRGSQTWASVSRGGMGGMGDSLIRVVYLRWREIARIRLSPFPSGCPLSRPPDIRLAVMIEYGPVEIAGKSYICPVRSLSISRGRSVAVLS